jgi:hypothetical protein
MGCPIPQERKPWPKDLDGNLNYSRQLLPYDSNSAMAMDEEFEGFTPYNG